MTKPTVYYNDTWRQEFVFCIGTPMEKMDQYLYKKYKVQPTPTPVYAAGKTAEIVNQNTGKSVIVIWIESDVFNRKNVAALGHEALHAANRVAVNRGHMLDAENDEAHAYLFTVIFEHALKLMRK